MKGQQLSFAAGQARSPCRWLSSFKTLSGNDRSLARYVRRGNNGKRLCEPQFSPPRPRLAWPSPRRHRLSSRRRLASSRSNPTSRCRRKRTKASRPATPGNPDLSGNRKRQLLPRIRPDVPIRAAARPRVQALAARVPRPVARHASVVREGGSRIVFEMRTGLTRSAMIGNANDSRQEPTA